MQTPPSKDMGTPHPSKRPTQSQDRKAVTPNQRHLHHSSNDTKTTIRSPESYGAYRSKCNRATDSEFSLPLHSLRNDAGHNRLSSRNRRPTYSSDSPTHSVRFSDPEYYIYYPESVQSSDPKARNSPPADSPLDKLSAQINAILYALVAFVKDFPSPATLEFAINDETPLLLEHSEINRPFIDQLCKINRLRTKLAGIPTYDDAKLRKQHRVVGMAIERALQSMNNHQLELYKKFRELNDPLFKLNHLLTNLDDCVNHFKFPPKLDFALGRNTLIPTANNQTFISQLGWLGEFRDKLNKVPACGDERLEQMHRHISVTIGRSLQRLKAYQLELYEQQTKVYRPHRT
ncbi:unnamed protein product [Rhizoctonia solani]|uniref:Uncharacterized protein n=1 Tax=Rhizoctonia solani TaxID=456999 RepID=A0A8H3HI52_9AGAM|nr:unnamed protein product [Rhizoctonia solani]CAE6518358.1 unnamed protein product [Rhizoctonia solani]